MWSLTIAALVFLAIHIGSSTKLRGILVARLGEPAWMAVFSALSLAAIVWLVWSYAALPPMEPLAQPHPAARWIANVLMPIAFLFVVPGLLTPNPSVVGQGNVLRMGDAGVGINAVTRHPFFWGVTIWAAAHLLNNLQPGDLVFFGSLGLLALVGTVAVDRKKRRQLGADWLAYEARTSNLPFAAIIQNRATLSLRSIGWWHVTIALLAWLVLLVLHPWLFGVSPLPA